MSCQVRSEWSETCPRNAQHPPPPELLVGLVHMKLKPFDLPFAARELEREEHLWGQEVASKTFRLEGRYAPGERLFAGLEVESETLDCPLRVWAARLEIPR